VRGLRHENLLQRSSTKGHRRAARGSRRTNPSQRSSWNSSRRSMNDPTRSARGLRHRNFSQRSSTKGHRRSARGSRHENLLQRSSTSDPRRSARGLRRNNLPQRTSVRSSRGFRGSRRSPTPSRTSTASFLRFPATTCPSPASSDGCSSPSSTTSGESSRCAPRPRGDEPGERGDRVQEGDLSPRPELLLGPSRSEPSVERTGPVGPSECEGGDLNPYRSNPTRT
jgi:hypothetical protein